MPTLHLTIAERDAILDFLEPCRDADDSDPLRTARTKVRATIVRPETRPARRGQRLRMVRDAAK